MKNTKKLCFFVAAMFAVTGLQAQMIQVTLPNPGFEEPGENSFPGGFEGPGEQPNVPGWFDLVPPSDSGIEGGSATVEEGDGAWWGTYNEGFSAFMSPDGAPNGAPADGAYNISEHTILDGDEYILGFVAKSWDGNSEFTVSLFYDNPANVIGTYVTALDGTWTEYSNPTPILATSESIGGTLGISFLNTGAGFANLDDVSITVIPEPSTLSMVVVLCAAGLLLRRRMRK